MFTKPCSDTATHAEHTHMYTWRKADLPHLIEPDKYPASWMTEYKCPGIAIEAWVTTFIAHEDCDGCRKAARKAVADAKREGERTSVWTIYDTVNNERIVHSARVAAV